MLNSYIKLLKQATEALTNVGGSNAGATEYFQAVGYEFAIITIGLLYLAGIAAVVAIPVLVFRQGVYKGGFASKTLKKFPNQVQDHSCYSFSSVCNFHASVISDVLLISLND